MRIALGNSPRASDDGGDQSPMVQALCAQPHSSVETELTSAVAAYDELPAVSFAAFESFVEFPLPLMTVNDIPLSIPIVSEDAVANFAQRGAAQESPCAGGSTTIVRAALQVEAAQIRFGNPHFLTFVQKLAERAATRLGASGTVTLTFRKLYICRNGVMFMPRKPGPGQFAAFCIQLPSVYEGSRVALSYAGDSIEFEIPEAYHMLYIAFLADAVPNVRPVNKGFKAVLVYDMAASSAPVATIKSPQHAPVDFKAMAERLELAAKAWHRAVLADELRVLAGDQFRVASAKNSRPEQPVLAMALKRMLPLRVLLQKPVSTTESTSSEWQRIVDELRGSDGVRARALFDAFVRAGLDVTIGPGLIDLGSASSSPPLPQTLAIREQGVERCGSQWPDLDLYVDASQVLCTPDVATQRGGGAALSVLYFYPTAAQGTALLHALERECPLDLAELREVCLLDPRVAARKPHVICRIVDDIARSGGASVNAHLAVLVCADPTVDIVALAQQAPPEHTAAVRLLVSAALPTMAASSRRDALAHMLGATRPSDATAATMSDCVGAGDDDDDDDDADTSGADEAGAKRARSR